MFNKVLSELLTKGEAYKLSKATGISEGLISDYKNDKVKPAIENLVKIADYFNVSADYLLGLSKHKERTAPSGTPEEAANTITQYILGRGCSREEYERLIDLIRVFFKKYD
jgi:transcriptional regulator with XRE-family HTH domain